MDTESFKTQKFQKVDLVCPHLCVVNSLLSFSFTQDAWLWSSYIWGSFRQRAIVEQERQGSIPVKMTTGCKAQSSESFCMNPQWAIASLRNSYWAQWEKGTVPAQDQLRQLPQVAEWQEVPTSAYLPPQSWKRKSISDGLVHHSPFLNTLSLPLLSRQGRRRGWHMTR